MSSIDIGLFDSPRLSGWALKGNSPDDLVSASPADLALGGNDLGTASSLSNAGMMLSVFGGLNSAVGAWYETNAQRGQLQSKKLSLEFESSMSHLNARRAERQAQQLLRAGERDIERYTMRAGQERAAAVAAQGARGVEGGVGSAVEELVSRDVVTALDVGSLSENAARAAGEARIQGVNFQNQAAIADVSAQNVARTRRTIRPGLAAASDLLSSAGTVASYWYGRRGGY